MHRMILHLSDWHCDADRFERRLEQIMDERRMMPDILAVSGDMILDPVMFWVNHRIAAEDQRREWEGMVAACGRLLPNVPIVAVPGNHDWCDYGGLPNVYSFDRPQGEIFEVDGLRIGGFRGVPDCGGKFDWSHELKDPRAFNWLMGEVDKAGPIDMLMVHSPPFGVLDHVNEYNKRGAYKKSVGVPGLAEWCGSHAALRLVCFGHIHEDGAEQEQNRGVLYSNASCAANWLWVDFDERA